MTPFRTTRNLLAVTLLTAGAAAADTLFEDGFEADALGASWSVTSTNQGRVRVTSDYQPASGSHHLVLDDSVSDALYSVSEATLALDLTDKRTVILNFKAKSLGDEPNTPPTGNFSASVRNFDGVSVSADGGVTWRCVQVLTNLTSAWSSFSVTLDSGVTALGGSFGPGFLIRFSEYDNSPAPIDGIAIDDVSITAVTDQRLVVELPSGVAEGGGPYAGYVETLIPQDLPMVVTLSASPAGQLDLPASVVIPAGETFQSFAFSSIDNSLNDGLRSVVVTAAAPGATTGTAMLSISDDEVPRATLTLPAELTEGAAAATGNAKLTLNHAATANLSFTLSSSPSGEVTLPGSVTVSAGQTEAAFSINAVNDTRIDGNIDVTVTASRTGFDPATATTRTIDNESRALALTLPDTLAEGGSGTGKVTVAGTLASPLTVTLSVAGESANALTLPATVTIPAGQTQASFTITAPDNTLSDGTREISVKASATTFDSGTAIVEITDNEVVYYRFDPLPELVNISDPVTVTLSGFDTNSLPESGLSGSVSLSVVLPDGSSLPVTPSTVALSGTGFTGTVTLPAVDVAPLKLRATDASGGFGESTSFDIMRVLPMVAGDLLWDAGHNRICASVSQDDGGAYANKVVAIDPHTLAVAASAATSQDPGKLVETSGGEYLYAALDANGTVAKIDPATMGIVSTFPVGVSTYYGTLYAEDMAAVAGQPDLLVVSQYRKSVSPRHNGVGVYDHGVVRPVQTPDHTGSNIIEPSSDPTVFFGQNTETTEYGFRRMKLDADGITVTNVTDGLINGFGSEMISQGDLVFSDNGAVIDGSKSRLLGNFGTRGPVRPDLAGNRVYFLENDDPNGYYFDDYNTVTAYDPQTLAPVRSLSLPDTVSWDAYPDSFIRWGSNGLAFRTTTSVVLITSPRLVPSGAPADLETTVRASTDTPGVGAPLVYTVQVTNHGPGVAGATMLTATLSGNQTLTRAESAGEATVTGATISTKLGDLAAGATATLTITTRTLAQGSVSCTARADSNAVDPDFSNNTRIKMLSTGYQTVPNAVNQLALAANNLVYDPARKVFWATLAATQPAPLGRSLVSIDAQTGAVSAPLPLNATPADRVMALSASGRYLYIGLSDVPDVLRADLSASPVTVTHLSLATSQWGDLNFAEDVEILAGDGTSFMIASNDDHAAAVYDNETMRPNRTPIYSVDSLTQGTTPDVFVGYNNYSSGFDLSKLVVDASGVQIGQHVSNVISGYYARIAGEGGLVLATNGTLVNSDTLRLLAKVQGTGVPVVDGRYARAYMALGSSIQGYEATGSLFDSLKLPAAGTTALGCVRWGADGFAESTADGHIYIARWSASIPDGVDQNGDGVSDAWAARNFASTVMDPSVDTDGDGIPDALEYLFGSDPHQADQASPLKGALQTASGVTSFHLSFPRRSGSGSSYRYETSTDLKTWTPVSAVTESTTPGQGADGTPVEMVDAALPVSAGPGTHLFRIVWIGH